MSSYDAVLLNLGGTSHYIMFCVPTNKCGPKLVSSKRACCKALTTSSHEYITRVNHPATFDSKEVAVELAKGFLNEKRPNFFLTVNLSK